MTPRCSSTHPGVCPIPWTVVSRSFSGRNHFSKKNNIPLNNHHHQHRKAFQQPSLLNVLIRTCRTRGGKAGDRRGIWLAYLFYERAPITILGVPARSSGSLSHDKFPLEDKERKSALGKNSQLTILTRTGNQSRDTVWSKTASIPICYVMVLNYFKVE